MGSYLRPDSLGEALAALDDAPRSVLAGGTDYYPARVGLPLDDDILDITAIGELRGITAGNGGVRIGALVRWSELADASLPPAFDGLRRAAAQIGGLQVQNAGTVCGNVCNASPAADGIPNLLVLEASVELASIAGTRMVPIGAFITGNRTTARRADELATALVMPAPPEGARSSFGKLGARTYLVISIAMVAALIAPARDGTVAAARIAVGACSAVAQRLAALEQALCGARIGPDLAKIPEPGHLATLAPIDDIRAPAEYRSDAALTLIRRALAELGEGAV
ncbi:MAG: FAD binding domain-containing protein [Alphaproteobacteria bacterium]|nr:FAD binding domain-containing protein [Alphaproteobacteria bacterium]